MRRKHRSRLLILLFLMTFILTGCTTYIKDDNNKRVVNEVTGQSVPANILCKPENQNLVNLYNKYDKNLEYKIADLPDCDDLKLYNSDSYSGLWAQLFVIPLAWYIVKVGELVQNYGFAIMIVGLLIRLILTPLTVKTAKQSQNMKNAQPELNKLEKKYKDKTDSDAMMKKSQEMMLIYKKYKVSPLGSRLVAFIQIPLFLAFLEAINRVPVIFEESLWTLQLGTTPLVGIKEGNYLYLILIALIILTTYLSFKFNMNSMGSPAQEQQMKFMTNFMLIFISIASFSLPTAIALYWVTTNAFAVVQNFYIKKRSVT